MLGHYKEDNLRGITKCGLRIVATGFNFELNISVLLNATRQLAHSETSWIVFLAFSKDTISKTFLEPFMIVNNKLQLQTYNMNTSNIYGLSILKLWSNL